MVMSSTVC